MNSIALFSFYKVHRGSWIDYVKEWTDFKEENVEYPLLNICYESMKKVGQTTFIISRGVENKIKKSLNVLIK